MKKIFSLLISILIAFGSVNVVAFAVYKDTSSKTLQDFTNEFLSFQVESEETLEQNDVLSEAVADDDSSTHRIIAKSDRKLDSLDSVGYLYGYNNIHLIQFDNKASLEKALVYYNSLPYVDYAEEDKILKETVIESDDDIIYESIVELPTSTQSDMFGYTNAKADMGTQNVTVAVVDSGAEYDHEYLEGRVVPTGFTSVANTTSCYDDRGHGTQVAGVIVSNTKENVTVKPYKVLDRFGEGTVAQVVLGIEAATADNVDVINLSMCMAGYSEALHQAVIEADEAGINVVVAAGNKASSLDEVMYSPAMFPEAITVMSCSEKRQVSDFSNYGSLADCAAPGENILSSYIGGKYKTSNGTSLASPFICAAVSYILSENNQLTNEQVEESLAAMYKPLYGSKLGSIVYPGEEIIKTNQTKTPTINIASCNFGNTITIELSCSTPNAKILYSVDNASTYSIYDGPITLTQTTNFSAYAISQGLKISDHTSAVYNCYGGPGTFVLDSNNNLIGYNGDKYVKIPKLIDNKVINGISESAFKGNTNISSVTVEYCTSIASNAFEGCTSLTSFSDKVSTSAGDNLFKNCTSLTNVTLSASKTIGVGSFDGCTALTDVNLAAITELYERAFYGITTLRKVTISNCLIVNDSAFEGCSSLSTVSANKITTIGDRAYYGTKLNSLYLNSLTKIGTEAFMNCTSLKTFTGNNVTSIGEFAFKGCTALTTVNLKKITVLPQGVFDECNAFTTIDLSGIKVFDPSVFANCQSIQSIILGSITELPAGAFNSFPNLDTVNLGKITAIPDNLFKDNNIITTVTASSATSIGSSAFENCVNLTKITANNVATLGVNAFKNCNNLTTVTFSKLTSIPEGAFANSGLTKVDFALVTAIDNTAFSGCDKITSVKLSKYENIDLNAFADSNQINTINFPIATVVGENQPVLSSAFPLLQSFSAAKLTVIPDNYFKDCINLTSVTLTAATTLGNYSFYNTGLASLTLANAATAGEYAFAENKALTTVTLKALHTLGDNAFNNTTGLVTINLPKLENVDVNTFSNCPNITSVTFSNLSNIDELFRVAQVFPNIEEFNSKIDNIPAEMFMGCSKLQTASFDCVSIGDRAFKDCVKLTKITLPYAEQIGVDVFDNTALTELSINSIAYLDDNIFGSSINTVEYISVNNVTSISDNDFSKYISLNTIYLRSLLNVPDDAFNGSNSLINIDISNATSVGARAFMNCTALEKLNIQKVTSAGENFITGCTSLRELVATNLDKKAVIYDLAQSDVIEYIAMAITEFPVGVTFKNHPSIATVVFNKVKDIPDEMFYNCVNLKIGSFNNAVTIGDYAFYNCPLSSNRPSFTYTTSIGDYAFAYTQLNGMTAPVLKTIGVGAFYGSTIPEVSITSTVFTTVPEKAFSQCKQLTSISCQYITRFEDEAFSYCTKLSYTYLGTVTHIGDYAFYNCSALRYISDIVINATYIGDYSFGGVHTNNSSTLNLSNCKYLGVDGLGYGRFDGVTLENVEVLNDIPNADYILAGSDLVSMNIDENDMHRTITTLYAPASTIAEEYCETNDINYVEFNSENAVLKDLPKLLVKNSTADFNIIGFNKITTRYGCNNEDRSDAVPDNSSTYNRRYYYYVVTSTENGNVLEISTGLCKNARYAVEGKPNSGARVILDYYNHSSGTADAIVLDTNDSLNTLDLLEFDPNATYVYNKYYNPKNIFGTGADIYVYDSKNATIHYIIIMLGDMNGDGAVDVIDCSTMSDYINNRETYNSKSCLNVAADIVRDNVLTVEDYQQMVNKAVS